jgi:subfamily B ATP-binding cassette protein HlyB/CyaB
MLVDKCGSTAHLIDQAQTLAGSRGVGVLIAQYHGVPIDAHQLRHVEGVGSEPFSAQELERAARSLGLKTQRVRVQVERLSRTPFPALVLDLEGQHCILAGCDGEKALIVEAGAVTPTIEEAGTVMARSDGQLLLFASRASLAGQLAHFDFSWFVPAIVKYRRLLLEVLGVSLLLQIFGLVSPLMFQVVMDKVLVNHTYSTLSVVCVTLFVCSTFEVLLTGLRTYVFSHTTNRIDVELGARLFRHLFAFPLNYFSARLGAWSIPSPACANWKTSATS